MFHISSVMGVRMISIVPPIAWLLPHLYKGFAYVYIFNANNILLSVIVNSSIIVLAFTLGVVGIFPGSLVVDKLTK